jgi:hypothetical protein
MGSLASSAPKHTHQAQQLCLDPEPSTPRALEPAYSLRPKVLQYLPSPRLYIILVVIVVVGGVVPSTCFHALYSHLSIAWFFCQGALVTSSNELALTNSANNTQGALVTSSGSIVLDTQTTHT